ncbi:MAG: hypothetical protein P8188_19330, partial [Gemmatimonadota bacterium]
LWRDANVRRDLGERWRSGTVMPRFVLTTDGLELIPDPLSSGALPRATRGRRLEVLEEHLRRYDRFYKEELLQLPPVLGSSILFRIGLAAVHGRQSRRLKLQMLRPDSEAARVTAAVVRSMREEVERSGQRFVLVLAPTGRELIDSRLPTPDLRAWHDLADALCEGAGSCIDLVGSLVGGGTPEADSGYDGTHYGPMTSQRVAEALLSELRSLGLVPQ